MTQSKETKSTPKTAKKSQKIQKNSKNSSKNAEKEVLLDKTYKFEDDNFYKVFMEQNSLTVERPIYDIIYANIIMLFAIFLSWLVPVLSFGLPILFFIYFEVGISGFAYKVENNENYKFEDLFVSLKKYIKVFCVFVIKMFMTAFFACFLLVPGIVVMLQYSFTGIILFQSDKLDVRGVLSLSKEMTRGFKWNIFLYEMIALATVCVAVTLMFWLIVLFDVFFVIPNYFYIIFVTMAGILDFMLVALPIVEIAIADSFISAKNSKIAKKS